MTGGMTGPRLAQARRIVGLSQVQLARSLGVAPATVRQWEQRGGCLPAGLVERISVALWAARQAQLARDLERFTHLASLARQGAHPDTSTPAYAHARVAVSLTDTLTR